MAVAAAGGCANGDEYRLGITYRGGEVGREGEPPGRDVLRHQLVETGFVDRHASFVECGQLVGIDLHDRDVGAEFGEAGAGDEADVAAADHSDAHGCGSLHLSAED